MGSSKFKLSCPLLQHDRESSLENVWIINSNLSLFNKVLLTKLLVYNVKVLYLFRMGVGQEASLVFFLIWNFSKGSISLQNFQISSFLNCEALTTPTFKTKLLFLIKSLRSCGYYNFSHKNASITKLWSHDHMDKIAWRNNFYFKM